ncbi:MAG: mandelate racemase/muconate lactonizing enzyme family protein [Lentisphaeria bacterium]|nr:mandelate racemase/muconate lactonizing enzyme family protein [Lentisphaeria bacterium]
MKITRIESILVGAPTPGVGLLSNRNYHFIKVHTDEGITGLGEATLESHDSSVLGALKDIECLVLGEDPTQIEYLTQKMVKQLFWKGGVIKGSAISGVELALWDILGKSLGQPVYKLVGGACRKKIRAYVNGWSGGSLDPAVVREKAQIAMAAGYNAFKFSLALPVWQVNDPANLRKIRLVSETIRETVGDDALIMYDGHGRYDADMAIKIGRIFEELDFFFFEEPCQPEDEEGLAKVASKIDVPVATGERLSFLPEFKRLLTRNCASIIQPDIGHSCGFGTALKASHLAEAFNAFVAPHGPMSPVVTTVSMHLDAVIPNFLIQERLFLNDWRNNVITEPIVVKDGYIELNDKPGWGIELDDELCKAHPAITPYTPQLIRPDGAVCDW